MAASGEIAPAAELSDAQHVRVIETLQTLQEQQDRILAQMRRAQRMIARKARALVEPLWDARQALVAGAATAAATKAEAEAAKSTSLSGFTFTDDAAVEAPASTTAPAADGDASESAAADGDGDGETLAPFSDFWLTVLTNHPLWEHLIEDEDQDALEYLVDCRVTSHEDWKGLTLTWTFRENPYFANTKLTKTVKFSAEMDTTDNVGVKMLEGCTIDWKDGKRLTKKTTKPKGGRRGGRGRGGKAEPKPSVFDFFERTVNPDAVAHQDLDEGELEEIHTQVSLDIQAIEVIREALCPRAVKWLTGEENADDSDDDDGFFMQEDDDEDEGDEGEGDAGGAPGSGIDAAQVQAALANAFGADASGDVGSNPFAASGSNPFAASGSNPFAAPTPGGTEGGETAAGEGGEEAGEQCKQQ